MSKVKEIYYRRFGGDEVMILPEIKDYIVELEQQLEESELRRNDLLKMLQQANKKNRDTL